MRKFISFLIIEILSIACYSAEFGEIDINKLREWYPEYKIPTPPAIIENNFLPQRNRWFGVDSRQAQMRFTTYLLYKIPRNYTGNVSNLMNDTREKNKIMEMIDWQVKHMYGAFTMHPGFTNNPGIPSGDYKITLISSEKDNHPSYAKIFYRYDDVVVFSSKIFKSNFLRIQFVLPADPSTIYQKGFPSSSTRKNYCTDEHYNSEDDFWYFWNPYKSGCPIKNEDLVAITADLQVLPMTNNTYPEYSKLFAPGSNPLKITYIVGIDENFQGGDLGRQTFENSFYSLKQAGMKVLNEQPRKKTLTTQVSGKKIIIEMMLMDPNSNSFAIETTKAMKTSDIFLYDGHSGLGGYLSPERLEYDSGEKLALPKDKYQIFYFNGCSTYAYYNSAFFNLKKHSADPKGTKNLDIITTGIGASFAVGSKVDVTFLLTITSGERLSWQEIMRKINRAEGSLSALTHVNGDEDNPHTP